MEQTILRSEVLKLADTGEPFHMIFVTADRRRGTGGELIEVKEWVKMSADAPREMLPGKTRRKAMDMTRSPNHWAHKTINIWNPNNKKVHPHKVHIRLIQFFNYKRVING